MRSLRRCLLWLVLLGQLGHLLTGMQAWSKAQEAEPDGVGYGTKPGAPRSAWAAHGRARLRPVRQRSNNIGAKPLHNDCAKSGTHTQPDMRSHSTLHGERRHRC